MLKKTVENLSGAIEKNKLMKAFCEGEKGKQKLQDLAPAVLFTYFWSFNTSEGWGNNGKNERLPQKFLKVK